MSETTKQFGRVGVLMGGISAEREISLKSGQAIVEALLRQGCQVVPLDIVDEEDKKILSLLQEKNINVAFIALHGRFGEDGAIQSILEKANIPYTGSGVNASRLAINKVLAQNLFKKNSINVPSYVTLSKGDQLNSEVVIEKLKGYPIVVKPACEGSSIGINLANTKEELENAIQSAWQYDEIALLEQYIEGRELTVGILGQSALPVVEIRPKCRFFDFEAKYTKGMADYVVPAEISKDVSKKLQQTALKAHKTLGCADFSRVDFMIDTNSTYYVLEVNTIPGFTATSLLPKAAQQQGISFDQLCFKLMKAAYGKKKESKSTAFHH